jgi:putative peptide zinc metalloprotease protein
MTASTLSDAWHQIADARVALLPSVKAQPQRFRGRPWVVLEDAHAHRFFRVTPQAWEFLRRLSAAETVDTQWRRWVQQEPQAAPGQDELVRLLSQLHVANLLRFEGTPPAQAIHERAQAQRRRERFAKALAFLFIRIPLWSPDRALDAIAPLVRACTGRAAAVLWMLVVLAGVATAIEHRGRLADAGEGLLSIANLPWLYLAIALVKVLHEAAHAFVCKRYGGHVPAAGIMLLVFTPLPYVDASASWALRGKWQRAYVGAAGMLAEAFLAGLAAIVWANTGAGLVNSLAFNVMVVGSVSSLLFNGNPLLRFDAYYILSDLAELPNLYQRAQAQWLHWGQRFLLGQPTGPEPAADAGERWWYGTYGALAFFYRLLVTATILVFVTDQWFALGVVLLATTAIAMLGLPLVKLGSHLRGPATARRRARAWAGVAVPMALAFALLFALPLPYHVRVPGVLEARGGGALYAAAAGRVAELPARHGDRVEAGALLVRLENPDLVHQGEVTAWQIAEAEVLLRQALAESPVEAAPLASRLAALRSRLAEIEALAARLEVRAPHAGEWVAPGLHERLANWVERGQPLGEVVDRAEPRFTAVLPQGEAADLFGLGRLEGGELRLAARRGQALPVASLELLPMQRERLASAALGFAGGGDVAVRPEDGSGTTASEPFFVLQGAIDPARLPALGAWRGMSGVLRVPAAPRTLADRGEAALRQLLQRRYGV